MNAKAYSRSTGRPRRGLYSCVPSAVLLLGLSAWAQPTPYPILTYQRPSAPEPPKYQVTNCPQQTTSPLPVARRP